MRLQFISRICALCAISGCIAYEVHPHQDEQGTSGDDCVGDCELEAHSLSGELILFVNGRLTDPEASFQSNLPLSETGTYLGSALYLYDPNLECEGGGSECRLVTLGHVRLDEGMGSVSVSDGSLKKFGFQDLAWHPELGLWATSYDALNDEWGIASIEIDDWTHVDQLFPATRYAIRPGEPEDPETDPCYWQEGVSALGFTGDTMLLGVRGAGGKGLDEEGMLYSVDLDVITAQGHCLYAADVSADSEYYACATLCEPFCSFGHKIGVAGDIEASPEGAAALAWLRSEDQTVMDLGMNELQRCVRPEAGDIAIGESTGVFVDDAVRGDEIDGLARIEGVLYGISVLGVVYELDEEGRVVHEIDDLGSLFEPLSLKVRGATKVYVPASD